MKKFQSIGFIFVALLFAACSSTDDAPKTNLENSNPQPVQISLLGHQVKATSNGNLLEATRGTRTDDGGPGIFTAESFEWTNPFNVRTAMPESKQDCLDYASLQDFCYVANGEPFDIVALYGAATFYHQVILHYQIGDNTYMQIVFDDQDLSPHCPDCDGTGIIGAWNDPNKKTCETCGGNGVLPAATIWYDFKQNKTNIWNGINNSTFQNSRLTNDAPAMKVTLPAGTIFYFECISLGNDGKPMPIYSVDNIPMEGNNDFYTIAAMNKNQKLQSVSFALDEWTLIGFEDQYYDKSDKDFNDVVIALNPVQYVSPEPKVNDGTVTPGNNIYKPEEYTENNDGTIDKNPQKPQENTTIEDIIKNSTSGDPAVYEDMVETNWAVNTQTHEKGYNTYYSKLSIHVRSNTDIKVTIPIADEYCCDPDDFAIVAKHDLDYKYVDGGSTTTTYNIDGHDVTLTITHKTNCIEIVSDGITADVQNYLQRTYGDGVTFEIWTWMNSIPETILDNSATIEFLDNDPDYYICTMCKDATESKDYWFQPPTGFTFFENFGNTDDESLYWKKVYKKNETTTPETPTE